MLLFLVLDLLKDVRMIKDGLFRYYNAIEVCDKFGVDEDVLIEYIDYCHILSGTDYHEPGAIYLDIHGIHNIFFKYCEVLDYISDLES